MKVGFIGLGNVGGKLAGALLRNGVDLTVRDLDEKIARPFVDAGAAWAESPAELMASVDIVVTCLPSPAASAAVLEAEDGLLGGCHRADTGNISIFADGARRYGEREWSPNIIRRLEDATGLEIRAPGFPAQMVDDEAEEAGSEVTPPDSQ